MIYNTKQKYRGGLSKIPGNAWLQHITAELSPHYGTSTALIILLMDVWAAIEAVTVSTRKQSFSTSFLKSKGKIRLWSDSREYAI